MSELIILVGNIASGKSIIARKFARNGCIIVNMDTIQGMLSGGIYGLYDTNKKEIYHAIENSAIESALKKNFDVVIDRTNVDIKRRKRFIAWGKKYKALIKCYDFGPGSGYNLDRIIYDHKKGISMDTWPEVFINIQKSYVKPTTKEGFDQVIDLPHVLKFKTHAFDFDGLIVEKKFPEIGKINDKVLAKMKDIWKDIFNIIIIWTHREDNSLAKMEKFLNKENIPFDFINRNPIVPMGGRKIFAHEYYVGKNSFHII